MSSLSLSVNSSIIGISFDRMNATKKKIDRAKEVAQDERNSLSKAISNLEVDDGRLRPTADALRSYSNRINNRVNSLERISLHIDYVVQRFQETDNLCAQRIKTSGYECRKSLGLIAEGGIFGDIVNGIVSVYDKGKEAWASITKSVGDFYENNKVLLNNIATITLETVAVGLTIAAIAAGAVTGVGLVLAIGAIVFSASNMVDSGCKVYNYCATGEEKGFNPLQKGFQAVLGDELGETVYNVTSIGLQVADLAVAGVGLVKAGIRIKNALKSGETLREALNIGRRMGKSGGQVLNDVANEEKVIEGTSLNRINKYGQTTRFADIDALGSTNPFTGDIKIMRGLKGDEFKETLRHELVHRFFTPRSGSLKELRQQIRWYGYDKSSLLRYSEEAIAEIYGTRNITKGLLFPIKNGYVTTENLLKEGAIIGGGIYLGDNYINDKMEGDK